MRTPALFVPWRDALLDRGYSAESTGGRRGIYMVRDRDGIGTAVGAMLHDRHAGEFAVALHITMPFSFADPPHDVVLVGGDLTEEGVRIDAPGPPLPGSTTWWPVEAAERAWTYLETHGLPWLDRFSRTATLVDHFESGLEPSTLRERIASLFGGGRDLPPALRSHLLFLAMLYERLDDPERALDRLRRYAAVCRVTSERERVVRRIQELEGRGSVSVGVSRDDFAARFGETWDAVFTGGPIREGAFRDRDWEQVLLPDLRDRPDPQYSAWLGAVGRAEEGTIVLTEVESAARHQVSSLTPPTDEGVSDALTRTHLEHFAFYAAVGPSGRWGVVVEEFYACLAGDHAFMEDFAAAAGGREALREAFLRWADTEWLVSDSHLAAVLDRVGW